MIFEDLTEVLDPEPHPAALNMAIDEVLLHGAARPLLRTYRWARPSVSFGYFGQHAEVQSAWPRREMVRRWTGGGIVPHGGDFTYTLIVPRACPLFKTGTAESYCTIHKLIASLLGDRIALAATTSEKISDACFQNPVQHDLVAGATKIAGAAQRRTQSALLHQGSIQSVDLPENFARLLAATFSPRVSRRELTNDELIEAEKLAAEKYATEAWTRRR